VNWIKSRLFWRIAGLYAFLSALALGGLLLMLGRQLEQRAILSRQSRVERILTAVSDELQSQGDTASILEKWQTAISAENGQLWLINSEGRAILPIQDGLPDDITIQSVAQTAMRSGQALRSIRLGEQKQHFVAAARSLHKELPTSEARILLALTTADSIRGEVEQIQSAATRAAVFTWLIGILCMAFVAAGIVGPLQSMSLNLHQSINPSQREDMLLTISDRDDELGQVATSLHGLEEERLEQINRLMNTERMARSSADLLTTVLDSMVEGVVAIDREQRIVFLNSAARHLLNISPAISIGHRLYEAVRVPAFLETVAEALNKDQIQTLEYRPSRQQIDLVLVAIPIIKGPHAGAVAVVRDISELRRLESMRRDFVSGVSHELKTPLTVIQACTDTLLGGAIDDKVAAERFLKQIDEQSERLLQLILSMLQLARVESGQLVLHPETVSLNSIVSEVLRGFQAIGDSKSVQIRLDSDNEVSVTTDIPSLQTILSNLVDNALKHTNRGGSICIEITSSATSVSIAVRDTGSGIPEELLGRIFERFYRVERDRSRECGGSGLGLAIVKHLCQAIGAQVSVKSELGRGSEFLLEFPKS
jgi:two-component system phosphate regulon sensor histidine kinase PhoR